MGGGKIGRKMTRNTDLDLHFHGDLSIDLFIYIPVN